MLALRLHCYGTCIPHFFIFRSSTCGFAFVIGLIALFSGFFIMMGFLWAVIGE